MPVQSPPDAVAGVPTLPGLREAWHGWSMIALLSSYLRDRCLELLLTDVFSAVDAHRNDTDRTSLLEAIESKYEALCAAFV